MAAGQRSNTAPTGACFDFRFDRSFVLPARLLGVRRHNSEVRVTDRDLHVRFGPWSLTSPLENIADVRITGPYSWPKVIGPPRLSMRDRGVTFATNAQQGLCICFVEPVPAITPFRWPGHTALTVTVASVPRLASLLMSSGGALVP
jgi:hypothetical protein